MAEAQHTPGQCCICLENLRDPKTLSCNHKFCQICITDYLQKSTRNSQNGLVMCPICRNNISEKDIDTLLERETIKQAVGVHSACVDQETTVFCDVCRENGKTENAVVWCRICSEAFCRDCSQCHKSMRITRGHLLTTLDTKHKDKALNLHLCTAHTERLIRFCCDCQKLLCTTCIDSDHKLCDVEDITNVLTTVPDGRKLLQEIQVYMSELVVLVERQKGNLCRFDRQRMEIRETIQNTVKEIVSFIKMEENKHLDTLDKESIRLTMQLNDNINNCEDLQGRFKKLTSVLETISTVGDEKDKLIILHQGKNETEKCRQLFVEQHSLASDQDLVYQKPSVVTEFLDSTDVLGTVTVTQKPISVPLSLHVKHYGERKLNPHKKINVKLESEDKYCWIRSVALLPGKRIVVLDKANRKIKVFHENGSYICHCDTEGAETVVKIDKCTFAVTTPDEIQIHSITDTIRQVSSIPAPTSCFSIARLNDGFIAVCGNYLKVIDDLGQERQSIDGARDITNGFQDAKFAVTDGTRERVYVTDFRGCKVIGFAVKQNTVQLPELFRYSHKELKNTSGIALTSEGYLLIGSITTNKIHLISSAGVCLAMYSSGLPYPLAIAFDESRLLLFVSNKSLEFKDRDTLLCLKFD